MAIPKNADKFTNVNGWSRKDFIKAFEGRFENAADIFDYFKPKKVKKVDVKED